MGIRDEVDDFIDGNGLCAPHPVSKTPPSGSDNGPMYTSEYYVILKKLGELTRYDIVSFDDLISRCLNLQGMLCRNPYPQPASQTGPDDYYGVLNACKALGNTWIPRRFLKAMARHLGALNTTNPGKWTAESFLIRQPQLLCAMISAAFPSKINPLHYIMRLVSTPLYLISALTIATSCIGVPTDRTDERRLSWHLLQTLKPISLLCYLASKLWYKRLYRDYGPTGMRAVATIYYNPHSVHPFSKYWVN